MGNKAFVIGGATIDTIIEYEDMESMVMHTKHDLKTFLLLEEGRKIEVTHQHHFSGGGATNAAVSFKKQGFEVGLFCKVGQDAYGAQILEELKHYGLDTRYVIQTTSHGTANSFVVPSLSGDRTLFAYRGANATLLTQDLPLQHLQQFDFVYITSLSQASAARLPEITRTAKAHGMRVAVNPGISQLKLGSGFLKTALSDIDTLILNYEEAQQLLASLTLNDLRFNLKLFFQETLRLGPRLVVVTNGAQGVHVGTADALYFHPSLPVNPVVNTLGAGDAFGSSFVSAIERGESVDNAIRYGLHNSASVVQYHDAKSGLLTLKELTQRVKAMDVTLCQTWSPLHDQ